MGTTSTRENSFGATAVGNSGQGQAVVRVLCSPLFIAAAAFLLRLAALYFFWHRASPAAFTGPFGYEEGCVAKSIALGQGFSSPLPLVQTGPTAWTAPIYPYLLAGIFKVWGIYSFRSHVAAQALNCLFVALTAIPIFAIGKRAFGLGTAVAASWLWVILPSAVHIPNADVWDTSLSALLLVSLFAATLTLRQNRDVKSWVLFGLLWALGGLTNPSMLALLPFFFGWLIWNQRRSRDRWPFGTVGTAIVVFALCVLPWTVRNYMTFKTFVPIRSVLGITLWMGNNPVAVGVNSFSTLPTLNAAQAEQFKATGEINYSRGKEREALSFILSHPAATLRHIVRQVGSFWFSVSDRPNAAWGTDPPYVKALLALNAVIIVFAAAGIATASKKKNSYIVPFMLVLGVFPLVYYVTYSLVRFRFPIEPLILLLSVYGAVEIGSLLISLGHDVERGNLAA